MDIVRFNIRVYGLLVNPRREVLLVDEEEFNTQFTKFPGGGLELGEGIRECLQREWMEETSQPIEVGDHFYTTDFFQQSAFHPQQQLISVYYFVKPLDELKTRTTTLPFDFEGMNEGGEKLSFRWMPVEKLTADTLTFPIDRVVAEKLIQHLK